MDWEEFVFEIASDIMQEQSPKRFDFMLLTLLQCSNSLLAL